MHLGALEPFLQLVPTACVEVWLWLMFVWVVSLLYLNG